MQLRQLLFYLLVFVLYPAWLLSGGIDYLCHRRTRIEETAGPTESWLHLAQFLVLGAAFAVAVLFTPTVTTIACVFAGVVAHTALSYIDVSYTVHRRFISPLEQLVHGAMDWIPIFGVALLVVLYWNQLAGDTSGAVALDAATSLRQKTLLVGSYFVLAGVPVVEELMRTLRRRTTAATASRPLT